MKTIYRSEEGKNRKLALYDRQLSRLSVPWRDVYVQTSFGKTHVVETGNVGFKTVDENAEEFIMVYEL